jgi:hypothetical protein
MEKLLILTWNECKLKVQFCINFVLTLKILIFLL